MPKNDLQKTLKQQTSELKSLQQARSEVIEERDKLRGEASQSLASVAVDKLMGRARSQAEKEIEATSLDLTVQELERRIKGKEAEIEQTKTEIALVKAEILQSEAMGIFDDVAALCPDLARKAERLKVLKSEVQTLLATNDARATGNAIMYRINAQERRMREFASSFQKEHARNKEENLF